jgi:hypothetical protein
MGDYGKATRHPWVCLLFLIPLLAGYEAGVVALGGDKPESLRNGADAWLRWGLGQSGIVHLWIVPVVIVGLFAVGSLLRWGDRPREPFGVLFGMIVESAIFAGVLWAISVNFRPILDRLGIELAINQTPWYQSAQARLMVRYVGAGIFEEFLFRLGLFTGLFLLLRAALLPTIIATLLAGLAAALLFAAAHHVGDGGEPMVPLRFAFRTLAGLFFTCLYVFRGFGIAVGAHAAYDVLVGVSNP